MRGMTFGDVAFVGGVNSSIVTDGLVVHLDAGNPLSYPGTGTIWTDLSGSGESLGLSGGVLYSNEGGGSLVTSAGVASRQLSRNLALGVTVEIIFKGNNIATRAQGPFTWPGEYGNHLNFYFPGDGSLRWETKYQSLGGALFTGPTLSNNTWYHATGTLVNGLSALYVNGMSTVSNSYAPGNFSSTHASEFIVGNFAGAFQGFISIVRVYGRALTASEVQQNFNVTRGRHGI